MKVLIRKLTRRICLAATLLVAISFLLSCLVEFVSPASWWIVSFFGLAVPYLVAILLLLVLFWLIAKPAFALIPVAALAIGYRQINAFFAFNISSQPVAQKSAEKIRILSWNVRNFVAITDNKERIKHNKQEIVASILSTNADVLCLQEFNHSSTKGAQDDNISLFTAKYPHYHFSRDLVKKNGFYEYGSIIFSRYPIVNRGRIRYRGRTAESLVFIDIAKGKDTIRIHTTHLQSFRFNEADYQDIEKIQQQDDETLRASLNIFQKMKRAFVQRGNQAATVRKQLDKSPYPSIITGDFNDVPNSFTWFHIKGNYSDAFLKKGFGVGRTYISLAPTLRIDYILSSPRWEVDHFDMIDEALSDHLMLVADLKLLPQRPEDVPLMFTF